MDGPNVNLAFHREIDSDIKKDFGLNILDVGSCGLHKVHGAFQAAVSDCMEFRWNFKSYVSAIQAYTSST